MAVVRHKEAIHSGHFMISEFDKDAEDEDVPDVTPAEDGSIPNIPMPLGMKQSITNYDADEEGSPENSPAPIPTLPEPKLPDLPSTSSARAIIDVSLNKLFQSMSIAYRRRLTSPKWNRFRGMRLRWKDKIRLNNVIWRCWHMQFVKGGQKILCAFANPLEIDNHNRPEGGTVLEGKYWKRKLNTIAQEYKRWRLFSSRKTVDLPHEAAVHHELETDNVDWDILFKTPFQYVEGSKDDNDLDFGTTSDDFFVDALFNSLQGHQPNMQPLPLPFPNPREMHRETTNADLVQPGLVQLQPNFDDLMDIEPMAPLSDWLTSRLPTIAENLEAEGAAQQQQQAVNATPVQSNGGQTFQSGGKVKNINRAMAIAEAEARNLDLTGALSIAEQQQQRSAAPMHISQMSAKPMQQERQQQLISGRSLSTIDPTSILTSPGQQQHQQQQQESKAFPTYPSEAPETYVIPQQTQSQQKMRSPEHRYLRDSFSSPTMPIVPEETKPVQYSSSTPYKLPSQTSSEHRIDSTAFEHKSKSRSLSGPSGISGGKPYAASLASLGKASSSGDQLPPNSELLRLLRSAKMEQQMKQQMLKSPSSTVQSSSYEQRSNQLSLPPPPPPRSNSSSSLPRPSSSNSLSPQPSTSHMYGLTGQQSLSSPGNLDYDPSLYSPMSETGSGMDCLSPKPSNYRGRTDTPQYAEHRRSIHINAEQKRRGSIKNGFDTLRSLIPSLSQSSSVKISKAALLHKGGEYLQQLKDERRGLEEQIMTLRAQVKAANCQIQLFHSMLPPNCTVGRRPGETADHTMQLYNQHVVQLTRRNWKYWIFSVLMRPLVESFDRSVGLEGYDDLQRTSLSWLDHHCNLSILRPSFVDSLRRLAMVSDLLNSSRFEEYALNAIRNGQFMEVPRALKPPKVEEVKEEEKQKPPYSHSKSNPDF